MCVLRAVALQVLIRDSWTALPSNVGYQAPTVAGVTPRVMPIGGGSITIFGADFGSGPCSSAPLRSAVTVLVTPVPGPGVSATFDAGTWVWSTFPPLATTPVNCSVLSWVHTAIQCMVPPSVDPNVTLVISVGGQVVTTRNALHMEAPVLSAVVPREAINTPGGAVVEVQGSGFPLPPWPVAVLVGGGLCDVEASSRTTTTSLRCRVPRGVGRVSVSLESPLQGSAPNASNSLTYDKPAIISVSTPYGRPLEGNFSVAVEGRVSAPP